MLIIVLTAVVLFVVLALGVGAAVLAIYLVSRSKYAPPAGRLEPRPARGLDDDPPPARSEIWGPGYAASSFDAPSFPDDSWRDDAPASAADDLGWSGSGDADFGGGGASDSWGSSDSPSSSDSGSSSSSSE